jgi:valyl-tRNA synthetase
MFAPWPKALGEDFYAHYQLDKAAVERIDARNELVGLGRNLRREGNLPANRRVPYVLKTTAALSPTELEILKLLLNAETLEVLPDYQAEKGTPVVHSPLGELYLPLAGLVDVEAERKRLGKEVEKILAEITKAEQRLSNPSFTEKAPPAVLKEHQQRLAEWIAKRDQVQAALARLKG